MSSPEVQLYPDERNRIIIAWSALQKKYAGKGDTRQNLIALATEAENRFREMGFLVDIDIANQELGDDGNFYTSPIINITGRVVEEEGGHDHARHAKEVQAGYADGHSGFINPNTGTYFN